MKLENPKPDELILLETQLDNSDFCIGTTMLWMEKNPDRVSFNTTMAACGTYGCVWGWYLSQRNRELEDWEPEYIKLEFGFDETNDESELMLSIFGMSNEGTLPQRKSRLLTHRDHLQAKIAEFTPAYAGSVAA